MFNKVSGSREHFEVLGRVVLFITVRVVDVFVFLKWSPDFLLANETMLVSITAHI